MKFNRNDNWDNDNINNKDNFNSFENNDSKDNNNQKFKFPSNVKKADMENNNNNKNNKMESDANNPGRTIKLRKKDITVKRIRFNHLLVKT